MSVYRNEAELVAQIERWHAGEGGDQSLHEFLGMSWEEYARWASPAVEPDELGPLETLIREYADHQSVRCGWPSGYKQWEYKQGVLVDCACGLVAELRKNGLPIEWAGPPPDNK